MRSTSIMFQGTGSDVGKSLIVAGLCRLLARRGITVAPFKAQNMSNNAAVTADGGEIGRAQWLQAFACGLEPSVHMNPVLLKPQSDKTSQVIVRGRVEATMGAQDYHAYRASLMPRVLESYHSLIAKYDMVLVEGAGSPAETNLRTNDIANMGFSRAANCPVILIGDIDRGGVIASIAGTAAVLSREDKAMIRGVLINKFRGDPALFAAGAADIERFSGWPFLGVIAHHPLLAQLPQEDSLALKDKKNSSAEGLHIIVLAYPHIANFDDIDPLANEPGIRLSWCKAGDVIPADAQLVILPGSKSTIADLEFVRAQGWDIDLMAHHRRGGRIMGICGGYQMLGKILTDPDGVEGNPASVQGLGLLDVATIFTGNKTVTSWQGTFENAAVSGYEIHVGQTTGSDCVRPFLQGERREEGACSKDGLVSGSYIHGLFANDFFRQRLRTLLGAPPSNYYYREHVLSILDDWADALEQSIDIERMLTLAQPLPKITTA